MYIKYTGRCVSHKIKKIRSVYNGSEKRNIIDRQRKYISDYKEMVYSDHDIFVRELISNGCDAVTKLKKLDMMGEYELPEDYKAKIEVMSIRKKRQ